MLVVLEVVAGAEVGRQIKIRQDQTCKIGRTNWADEVFADDVMMSGQHFEVQNDGKYCWLRDLESRNGTRVDEDFVKENLVLRDGQAVQAGRTQFIVKIDGGAKNPYESTSFGSFEPVKNPALMSMQLGSQSLPAAGSDPQFTPQDHSGQPTSPAAPTSPLVGGIEPQSPPAGPPISPVPGPPGPGNIELPPNETPRFSPPGAGFSSPGATPLPNTGKNPPWIPPGQSPLTAGKPLSPGMPPAGAPSQGTPPIGRSGDGPVFKFAKIPSQPGPEVASPPGVPGNLPPQSGPLSRSEVPNQQGFTPRPPSPSTPLPPGSKGSLPPHGPSNFEPGLGSPQFSSFPPGPAKGPQMPGGDCSPSPPGGAIAPNTGFGGGFNPNLDLGPGLEFDEEPGDGPAFTPTPFAESSGPAFPPQLGTGGVNPNLIGISDDESSGPIFPGLPGEGGFTPPAGSNWRNPEYLSSEPPAAKQLDLPTPALSGGDAPSVHGLCFREETTSASYPVYRSILEGVPQVPFCPSALVAQISKIAKPVLAIHFLRAERPIPEDLEGVPLRGDLDPKFAALGGPMLYAPKDLRPFCEIIDELWGTDSISCLFTSGDPQAIIDHFRQGLFGPRRGDLPSGGPGPQFFAVFSPNLLTTFLASRDRGTVDELLGNPIDGVLTEIADMPDSWQLYTRKPWTQQLKQLGMNRVVSQPQTV